jgi:hypothetical protein
VENREPVFVERIDRFEIRQFRSKRVSLVYRKGRSNDLSPAPVTANGLIGRIGRIGRIF